jgi:hypothetical protein
VFRISIHTINITTVADAGSVNIGNTVNAVQKQQVIEKPQPVPSPQKPEGPSIPEPTVPGPSPPGNPDGGDSSSPPGGPVGTRSFASGKRPGALWARLPHPPAIPRPVSGYRHPVVVISPPV